MKTRYQGLKQCTKLLAGDQIVFQFILYCWSMYMYIIVRILCVMCSYS